MSQKQQSGALRDIEQTGLKRRILKVVKIVEKNKPN